MPTHTTSCASMQAGRAAVLGLATVLAATGAATGTAGVLASTPTSFKFVASTKGPSFVFGGGVDAVLASNDGSGNIYACGKSGALGLWSLAGASLTLKHGQPPGPPPLSFSSFAKTRQCCCDRQHSYNFDTDDVVTPKRETGRDQRMQRLDVPSPDGTGWPANARRVC